MNVLDITGFQSCSFNNLSATQKDINEALAKIAAAGVLTKCIIRNDVDRNTPSFSIDLMQCIGTTSLLRLDLAGANDSVSTLLLTRFMVTHGIRQWFLLPVCSSNIPECVLHEAASKAGVCIKLVHDNDHEPQPNCSSRAELSSTQKPLLAIVAPLPPTKSGIADYVARQLHYLQDDYQLVLVDDSVEEFAVGGTFLGERITPKAFLERPELHRRVLYHLGNSPTHLTAFKLLAQVPGLVVLHDFYLSDVQQYEDIVLNCKERASFGELIYSHGYSALLDAADREQSINLSNYPCNLRVLEQATKVLVHSSYVLSEARAWYGHKITNRIGQIGFARELMPAIDPQVARKMLGYEDANYLVGTFGFVTPAKCIETLINAWATSRFSQDKNAMLIIGGEFLDERYEARIHRLVELRQCSNIKFLGYIEQADYELYLNAIDIAVQLRIRSRGETSAALIDCLACGVPVIANNHGFVEDLPERVLWKVRAQPDVSELAAVIEHLSNAQSTCNRLAINAREYVGQEFNPQHVAAELVRQVEATVASGVCLTADGIARQIGLQEPPVSDLQRIRVAQALAYNQPEGYNHQLLVDVTVVARNDLRTGIQRVVRALLKEFILTPPQGYRILPVYLDQEGVYRYANRFMLKMLGQPLDCLEDQVVQIYSEDIYLGVDLHTTTMVRNASVYEEWQKGGVRIINVLYDLLPVRSPQWFPAMVEPDFTAWVRHIAQKSDGVLAISKTVAEDFAAWVSEQGINQQRNKPVDIGWFHLGSDLDATVPTKGLPDDAEKVLARIAGAASFLMVGTVEPRKGHAQSLAAFEQLWAEGRDYNLVIVGKEGWHVEEVAEKLRNHSRLGRQLFWLEGISDEYLERIYPCCIALLASSEGEGFGLPLIEAARHNIPVIARDIPVFREIGGEGAYYVKAETSFQLAQEVQAWVQCLPEERPNPKAIRCLNWQESAAQAKEFITRPSFTRQRVF